MSEPFDAPQDYPGWIDDPKAVAAIAALQPDGIILTPPHSDNPLIVGLLVAASETVTEGLELTPRLQTIVTVARELVGARYGALGVIGTNRMPTASARRRAVLVLPVELT